MTGAPGPPPLDTAFAIRALALDALGAQLVDELEGAGIPSIMLKGPAIATWLYRDREIRTYGDADLLVPPAQWEAASGLLRRLGFEDDLGPLAHPRMESIASTGWVRGSDNVDMHCTLWGIEAGPQRAWEVLSAHTAPMKVGGRVVQVLEPATRAMHVALHAAQHGQPHGKPIRDLELALEQLPDDLWVESAAVAAELDATAGFATGLRMLPAGRALAERLGIQDAGSVDSLLRVAQVPLAHGFEELATTPGLRGKLAVLRGEVFPNAAFMRWWSPLASRGRLGLAAAYAWRPLYLALKAGPGLLAWRRARRAAG